MKTYTSFILEQEISDMQNRIKVKRFLGQDKYDKLLEDITKSLQNVIRKWSPSEAKKIQVTDIELSKVSIDKPNKLVHITAEIFISEGHHASLTVTVNMKDKSWKFIPFLGL